MFQGPNSTAKGISLPELLLSLLILANIAAFAIPKVIGTQQAQTNRVILKEVVGMMAGITHQGVLTQELKGSNFQSFFTSRINAVKLCNTNASTQGCWNTAIQGSTGEETSPGVILATGATIAGINNTGSQYDGFIVDANGVQGPNLQGEDQLYLAVCFGPSPCSSVFWDGGKRPSAPGTIGPVGSWASSGLYDELFSQ